MCRCEVCRSKKCEKTLCRCSHALCGHTLCRDLTRARSVKCSNTTVTRNSCETFTVRGALNLCMCGNVATQIAPALSGARTHTDVSHTRA